MKKKYFIIPVLYALLFGMVSCQKTNPSDSSVSSEMSSSSITSSEISSSETSPDTSSESSSEISSETSSESSSSSSSSSSDSTWEIQWDDSQNSLRNGTKEIDFYNLNDMHGAIENTSEEPGIAKLATYLKDKKADNSNGFVLTSSGDMWQGSADSNITRGALVTDWMNYMGFSAMALGNHEFDWTIDAIKQNQSMADFPFLACNIVNSETNEVVDWASPYATLTRNGIRIGIIGAIGEGITNSILASNVRGLTFANPDSYVAQWSTYLKNNGADVILYLYHGTTNEMSNTIASYCDAAFGGHNHKTERNTIGMSNVPAVEGGSNGKYVSHINLKYTFNTATVTYGNYGYDNSGLMRKSDDQGSLDVKAKYAEQINTIKNEEVARIPYYLDAYDDVPHYYNKYAYRYYMDNETNPQSVYAVVTNNGRAGISSGVVTYGDIYKALPFDNYLVLFCATGRNIKRISNYSSSHWYIPSVSEDTISYDQSAQYFDDYTTYYVLTINYISENESYSSWLTPDKEFLEDEALPRNIFKHYLSLDYPL